MAGLEVSSNLTSPPEINAFNSALYRQLKIRKSAWILGGILFLHTASCFFLMAWAQEKKSRASGVLIRCTLTGLINGALYSNGLTELILKSWDDLHQVWESWKKSKSFKLPSIPSIFYYLILINFSSCGALLMPGDFFSINQAKKIYSQDLIWINALSLWLYESLLMQAPIRALIISPLQKLWNWYQKSEHPCPDLKFSFPLITKLVLGSFLFFISVPFYLGATGSMERAAEKMTGIRYFPWWLLSNLFLIDTAMASAIAGSSMLLLFTYYPTKGLYATLDHLIFRPFNYASKVQHPNPLIPIKSLINWTLRVGILTACIYGLLSALAIEEEGQKKMIEDGGLPGRVIKQYANWGFSTAKQVFMIAPFLNINGLFGFLDALQKMAQLGFKPACFFLCSTQEYSDQEKLEHWKKELDIENSNNAKIPQDHIPLKSRKKLADYPVLINDYSNKLSNAGDHQAYQRLP